MSAARRPGPAYLRALPLLLIICTLGLAVGPVGHALATHKHLPRVVAVAGSGATDELGGAHRGELVADVPGAPATVSLLRAWAGPADPSSITSSVTAQSPPVRGPPAEAAG
jgi:hypothetical protein